MTKKLEEEFNLPPIEEATAKENAEATEKFDVQEVTHVDIEDVQTALSNAEKIDLALKNVKGLDEHDDEMDDIGQQAIDSYQQLMNLGMNVGDREAGSIFDSAAKMLKTALEAKESKIDTKLKQIDSGGWPEGVKDSLLSSKGFFDWTHKKRFNEGGSGWGGGPPSEV